MRTRCSCSWLFSSRMRLLLQSTTNTWPSLSNDKYQGCLTSTNEHSTSPWTSTSLTYTHSQRRTLTHSTVVCHCHVLMFCITTLLITTTTVNYYYCHDQGRSQEFAKGDKPRGLGDRSPPAGSRGRAPVGIWRQSPQKPETNVDKKNKQTTNMRQ